MRFRPRPVGPLCYHGTRKWMVDEVEYWFPVVHVQHTTRGIVILANVPKVHLTVTVHVLAPIQSLMKRWTMWNMRWR